MIAEWFISYTLASKCSALWSRTNYGVTHQEVGQRSREDRAIISWPEAWNPKDTTVTATLALFPTGKKLLKPKIPPGPLFRAADPAFVIVRPCGKSAACAAEYATGQVIISEKSPAVDVFGRYYVSELARGEVGLYERGKGLQASLAIVEKSAGTGSAEPR